MACWYCSVRPAEANHMLETNLNGDVDALKSYDQTKVAYNVRHVGIPRCGDCHRRHRLAKGIRGFAAIAGVSLILSAVAVVFHWLDPLYTGIWVGLSAGLMIGGLVAGNLVQTGIHTERKSLHQYPEIKDLRDKGYRFGIRPRQAKPTSQPASPTTVAPISPPPSAPSMSARMDTTDDDE